jgi:hypothetical protein
MKTFITYLQHIAAGLILSATLSSCSDSFLNDNPELLNTSYGERYVIYVSPKWDMLDFPIDCPPAGNARFSLSNVPAWLNVSSESGQFTDGRAYISCSASANPDFVEKGIYIVSITINIEGVRKYAIPVYYVNEDSFFSGNSELGYESDFIDFGGADTVRQFRFWNSGDGMLLWEIVDCPEWITVSPKRGLLPAYSNGELRITCDRKDLPAGVNSDVIKLSSNEINKPAHYITVKCRNGTANSDNVKAISGKVSDAWFDKSEDRLYLSTQQPNRLLVYDVNSRKTEYEIVLQNAPTCFSVSEDKQKIAIGYEGKIGFINMNLLAAEKTDEKIVEVETIVFDLEWGIGNWCCYTPTAYEQWCDLRWVNATSGEQHKSAYSIYGGAILKKIPSQNHIIATNLPLTASGIMVIDAETKELVNDIFEDIQRFWFSSDGAYMFSEYNNVYRTSSFMSAEVFPVAQLKLGSDRCKWIDHNPNTQSLWALSGDNDYFVWHLAMNDYTVINKFPYDEVYPTTIDGTYKEYTVKAHYVFANSDDSEVIVIKNVENDYANAWSMEYVTVKK